MATTAHIITSHYDPADRERLERETGQYSDSAEAWEIEAKLAFKRRLAPAPRFVPASGSNESIPAPEVKKSTSEDIGGWYKALTTRTETQSKPRAQMHLPPKDPCPPQVTERRTRNNWFIMNAIDSEPASVASPTSHPSLADILEREPPPLPHEAPHKVPVFVAIGPGNKGFAMLQQSGWSEGEALGPDIARQSKRRRIIQPSVSPPVDDGASREVVDLTMSDEDSGDEEPDTSADDQNLTNTESDGGRKALLTPLGIVLKSDRLGIGLKAVTTGPYRASKKRITPNAKALAAHIRASEQLKRDKQKHGRGHRGFARRQKKEETNRRALLAYMNES
ncbi:G-patch domain-containing protein [Mycena indigotica]|uniref:G-patch domain-containing protein n=1 Tax=Mycena indigotica TaxID=2126181 RepID=A0A8H6SJI0_9AGAR|nr:G-patch domain-containing protein [Mycena indigotica]KAF7298990.1 G-patch domain-containing protein [Mycena indigotica]